jgi:hypothetical protein
MSGHERTVRVALLSYRDENGLDRIAMRGQKELERAERLGAVVEGDLEDGPAATVAQPQPPVDPAVAGLTEGGEVAGEAETASASAADGSGRPGRQSSKGAWVDYAVSRGMDRDEAESMTRDQLITATD